MAQREDIKLEPKYPWICYGDGYMGLVISIMAGKDNEGKDVWKIRIIPTEELAKRHNIPLDALDPSNLSIQVEYPLETITQLSSDPIYPVYFCFLNFKGEDCPGTMFWKGKMDADKIMGLNKIIDLLKAENAYLTEQLQIARTNIEEFNARYVSGPVEQITSKMLPSYPSGGLPTSPVRSL